MTPGRQKTALRLMNIERYKVDVEAGMVYSYRKGKDAWLPIGRKINYDYWQVVFSEKGKDYIFGLHSIIYLAHYGLYDPDMVIKHKDGDLGNNKYWNLEAVSFEQTLNYSYTKGTDLSKVREKEITIIRKALDSGETNISRIAEKVLRPISTVRYAVKKIQSGEKLKFEDREKNRKVAGSKIKKTQQVIDEEL
jgi:hypothetical protein